MHGLDDYEPTVGKNVIEELRLLAQQLEGYTVQNVNSTAVGGGVVEILMRMVPLLNEMGVHTEWDVIEGDGRFFDFTKRVHNAFHGRKEEFTAEDFQVFTETTEANLRTLELDGDFVYIHDPQPVGLVKARGNGKNHWIWRCHINFSQPQQEVWAFLNPFIEQYDAAVFSAPSFAQPLSVRQVLISPSIDPLSDKNRELPQEVVDQVLDRFEIDRKRPIITQISRFDYLKDPVGVIDVYDIVKQYVDCQLVLAGGEASDDPEGPEVLAQVQAKAAEDQDIHVLLLPHASDIEINALQRASSVIVQKSLKEGFGLTVAEALWKGKPMVASAVGGIPLQITHRYSGLLSHTVEGMAYWVRQLLNDPAYGRRLGENGREQVRQKSLITRHIRDYLLLFLSLLHPGDIVRL